MSTMCIVHKGFRGFRAVSPASVLGGNLISLKPAIPYDTIHSTLWFILNPGSKKSHDYGIFKLKMFLGKELKTEKNAGLGICPSRCNGRLPLKLAS